MATTKGTPSNTTVKTLWDLILRRTSPHLHTSVKAGVLPSSPWSIGGVGGGVGNSSGGIICEYVRVFILGCAGSVATMGKATTEGVSWGGTTLARRWNRRSLNDDHMGFFRENLKRTSSEEPATERVDRVSTGTFSSMHPGSWRRRRRPFRPSFRTLLLSWAPPPKNAAIRPNVPTIATSRRLRSGPSAQLDWSDAGRRRGAAGSSTRLARGGLSTARSRSPCRGGSPARGPSGRPAQEPGPGCTPQLSTRFLGAGRASGPNSADKHCAANFSPDLWLLTLTFAPTY